MKIKDVELKDNRNLLTKAQEFRNSKVDYEIPLTLGRPKKDKQCMAMDACVRNVLHGFTNDLMYAGAPKFLGYAMLSNISQEALIRAGVDTVADECTRKFYKLRYVDEKGGNHEDFVNEINEEAERLHLKKVFNRAFKMVGYYGGCLGYIDVGDIDDEEKKEPLILDKKTIKKGMIKGIKLIEPINIYPGYYNTTDPTADDYFVPQSWYILGKEIHASRFLYFSKNEAPLLLKPAYNFFGIPDAQLVLDYVAHFVENRESAQELLHKFSLTCFGTDMGQQLQGESFKDLKNRIGVLNKFRNNNGTFVFDKEKEEITQLNTPLGGVREIVDMSLNLLCAIFRIPKIRLLGEGEGGLNASSVEQTRTFYDYINATKEVMARNPLTDAIKLCQLNLGYEPDANLKIDFPALWEMDDKEKADLNKVKADRDIAYINAGVLSQEEVRQSLSLDNDSGYDMIDVEDLPEMNEEDDFSEENEEKIGEKERDDKTTNDEDCFSEKVEKIMTRKEDVVSDSNFFNKVLCFFKKNGKTIAIKEKDTPEIIDKRYNFVKTYGVSENNAIELSKNAVLDDEGMPMVCYRGAIVEPEDDVGGNSPISQTNKVFCLSNKKEKAEGFGKVRRYFVISKKPLLSNSVSETKEKFNNKDYDVSVMCFKDEKEITVKHKENLVLID